MDMFGSVTDPVIATQKFQNFFKKKPRSPSVVITDETSTSSGINSPGSRGTNRQKNNTEGSITGKLPLVLITSHTQNGKTKKDPKNGACAGSDNSEDIEEGSTVATKLRKKCITRKPLKVVLGIGTMAMICGTWVGSTHLLKHGYNLEFEFTNVSSEEDIFSPRIVVRKSESPLYTVPFFTSWLVTSWTTLCLPVYLITRLIFGNVKPSQIFTEARESALGFKDKGFSLGSFTLRCVSFCALWTIVNYMYLQALRILDATDVMALFSTNVIFIYVLSWVVLHEQFVGLRIVALILCNTGIALLAYMDGIVKSPTLGGVVLAAASSAGSAVYKVTFRRVFGDATFQQVSLFFSLIGALSILLLWPVVLTLHFTGTEVVRWHHIPWGYLCFSGILTFIATLLSNFGPSFTFEIFVHLGLGFAVVVSAILDSVFNAVTFKGMKLGGLAMIVCGFVLVMFPENWPEYLSRLLR
ncbi:solute carrier family 35 member F3-like isoform X2 [Artemia franciscana]